MCSVLAVSYNRRFLTMGKVRAELSRKNKYWISKHRFYELYHFCLQYQEWKDEYNTLDGKKAINMDGMPHGSSVGSPTEALGIRRAELYNKIHLVEAIANEADPALSKYILKGVTEEGITFTYLQMRMGINCAPGTYYDRRRRFFWLLDKKYKKV